MTLYDPPSFIRKKDFILTAAQVSTLILYTMVGLCLLESPDYWEITAIYINTDTPIQLRGDKKGNI